MASGYTPAQIAQAQQIVNQGLAGPIAQTRQAQSQADAAARAKATQIAGFTQALAKMLGQIAPETQQTFADASQRQAAFGKGYSQNLQDTTSADAQQQNDLIAKLGGSGQVQDRGQALGNVLYGLGGAIPANSLNTVGAAYTAAAQQLPGMAAGRGQQDLAANLAAQTKTDQGFTNTIAGYNAQRPKLLNSTLASLSAQDLRQKAYDAAMQRLQGTLTGTYTDPATGKTVPTYAAQTAADKKAAKLAASHAAGITKRTGATATAIDTLTTYAEGKLGLVKIGQHPITKSTTINPPPGSGLAKQTKTLYLLPDGTYTQNAHDPNIVQQPVYDKTQHVSKLSQQQFTQVWGYTVRYLKANLGRYGLKTSDYQKLAHQILDPLAPPRPQPAPPTTSSTNSSGGTTTVTGP